MTGVAIERKPVSSKNLGAYHHSTMCCNTSHHLHSFLPELNTSEPSEPLIELSFGMGHSSALMLAQYLHPPHLCKSGVLWRNMVGQTPGSAYISQEQYQDEPFIKPSLRQKNILECSEARVPVDSGEVTSVPRGKRRSVQ